MFCILKCGIQVSNFYFNDGISWYLTSIKSNFNRHIFGKSEFKKYLEPDKRFNQLCQNVFISVIIMYNEPLFLEHNEPLTNDEIQTLEVLENQGIQEFREINKAMVNLQQVE